MEAVGKTTAFFMDIQQKNTSLKKNGCTWQPFLFRKT